MSQKITDHFDCAMTLLDDAMNLQKIDYESMGLHAIEEMKKIFRNSAMSCFLQARKSLKLGHEESTLFYMHLGDFFEGKLNELISAADDFFKKKQG